MAQDGHSGAASLALTKVPRIKVATTWVGAPLPSRARGRSPQPCGASPCFPVSVDFFSRHSEHALMCCAVLRCAVLIADLHRQGPPGGFCCGRGRRRQGGFRSRPGGCGAGGAGGGGAGAEGGSGGRETPPVASVHGARAGGRPADWLAEGQEAEPRPAPGEGTCLSACASTRSGGCFSPPIRSLAGTAMAQGRALQCDPGAAACPRFPHFCKGCVHACTAGDQQHAKQRPVRAPQLP